MTDLEIGTVERHIDTCLLCRQLVSYSVGASIEWGEAPASLKQEQGAVASTEATGEEEEPETPTQPTAPSWFLPPDDPWLGQTLGPFVLEERLGKGGMGSVYKARHVTEGAVVAVKILASDSSLSKDMIKRFQREARTLSRLKHPHIVEVLDFGLLHSRQGYYLTMEYLQGPTLRQYTKGRSLPLSTVTSLAKQLCEALACMHRHGVVHRDLKPGNIVLESSDCQPPMLKLIDFGLVSVQGETRLTRSGYMMGSPRYMSPEQAIGRPERVGPATDIYSLGVMLMELLTGRPPFSSVHMEELLQLHMTQPPPALHKQRPEVRWSTQLEALLWSALAKQPEQRPQDVESFLRGFLQACQSQHQLDPLLH